MKRAGAQAAAYARRPGADAWGHLVFGRDRNHVREVADSLQAGLGLSDDPFATTRMGDDELRADPVRLQDELHSLSLLGGARLVRVRCEQDPAGGVVARTVADVLAAGRPPAAVLIVEAGDLSVRSMLRKTFEEAGPLMALHLYDMSGEDIADYARSLAQAAGARFDPEALERFCASAPRDRGMVRSEVEKAALYAGDAGEIDLAVLAAVSAGERSEGFDEAADAALEGAAGTALGAFDKAVVASGASVVGALKTLERRLLRLLDAHALASDGQNVAAFGPRLSPPVFRSEITRFERVLQRWPPGRVVAALGRLRDTERRVKRAGAPAESLVGELLLTLARAQR